MSFCRNMSTLLAAVCLCAPALADPVTIATATGEVTVEDMPQTLAVLDISAVDTLTALGVPIAGMPGRHFVDYLDDVAAKATSVGSVMEPDYEAMANLNPDLIVIGSRTSSKMEPLSELAPTIDMTVTSADPIPDLMARLNAFGAVTGTQARAKELEAELAAKIERLKGSVAGRGNGLILLTNGPKVAAFGAGSRFGWIHAAAGLPEAVESLNVQNHGEAVSFEFIAETNPDWLIVIDRAAAIGQEGAAAAVTLDNALVAGTTAWSKGQVIYLNPADAYVAGGGYTSVTRTLDTLIAEFGDGA